MAVFPVICYTFPYRLIFGRLTSKKIDPAAWSGISVSSWTEPILRRGQKQLREVHQS